jgi:tetratricopeptide (TPR) repeat protein
MGMGNNPSWFSRKGNGRNSVLNISNEELKLFPVEMVSWDDVQAFLKNLNEQERGRGYWYRLPTEAEWEYACRGGATSLEECSYHFYLDKPTNDLSSEQANFIGAIPHGKAPSGPSLQRPTRVGAYPSNKLGVCDMHGNVWQWTDTAEGSDRVIRGGGWGQNGTECRAAHRLREPPSGRGSSIGFRLARVPVSADAAALRASDPLEQGRACAARRDWGQAADGYALALKRGPTDDGHFWFEYAALSLLAGDRPGYVKTCAHLIERCGKASDLRAYHVARACTLAPDAVAEASLPGRLAEKELQASAREFWSLTEQGALAYRAGRFQQAAAFFEQSLRADPKPGRAVLNWLWLALANQRLAKAEEARRWLDPCFFSVGSVEV